MLEPIPFAGMVEIDESFDRTASHMAGEYVSYNEPVAWRWKYVKENGELFTGWQYWHEEPTIPNKDKKYLEPLYTTPQIKELSDEEIYKLAGEFWIDGSFDDGELDYVGFARAILKKASEK